MFQGFLLIPLHRHNRISPAALDKDDKLGNNDERNNQETDGEHGSQLYIWRQHYHGNLGSQASIFLRAASAQQRDFLQATGKGKTTLMGSPLA